MSSPLNDTAPLSSSPLANLTPRQRLENALDELPPAAPRRRPRARSRR